MSDPHKVVVKNVGLVSDAADDVATVERALRRVGLDRLADELSDAFFKLQGAAVEIDVAVRQWLDRDLLRAKESAGNILQATLAGLSVKQEGT